MYSTRIPDTQRFECLRVQWVSVTSNANQPQVGGLPLGELNHLELQFLLLNDFRLSVPVEELEAYGTMLVEFYAREVMAQQGGGPSVDALYMQTTGH